MSWKPVNKENQVREIKEYPVGGDPEPTETYVEFKTIEASPSMVSTEDMDVIKSVAAKRGRPKKAAAAPAETGDPVNHPPHYKVGGIETIDFIEAKALSYHLGNVVKYITRADHKGNRLQDLEKARWYLDREISRLKDV